MKNSSHINFKELAKFMSEDKEDKDIIEFKKEVSALNENANHQKIFDLCSKFLIKLEKMSFTNSELVSKL